MKKKSVENVVVIPLTKGELGRLAELETDIGSTVGSMFAQSLVAGRALAEINKLRLYRARYSTFEKYVVAKFEMRRSYAYELINANKVMTILSGAPDIVDIESMVGSVAQLRPLMKLVDDPEKVIRAWLDAERLADDAGDRGPLTAAVINKAVRNIIGIQRPKFASTRRKATPELYRQPKKMAKYIIDTMSREYVAQLAVMLSAGLAPAQDQDAPTQVAAVS